VGKEAEIIAMATNVLSEVLLLQCGCLQASPTKKAKPLWAELFGFGSFAVRREAFQQFQNERYTGMSASRKPA